jgi:hypothetical protein
MTRHVKTTVITAVGTAMAAATIALPAIVYAEPSSRYQFLSPSGNIACQMDQRDDGTGYAWCKVDGHEWAAQPGTDCQAAYLPGAIGQPGGEDLQLSQGNTPCLGFVMSQIFFSGQYAPAPLDYGQTHTVGTITCESAPSGVTCTDAGTGHFFRVSGESYQLG